MDDKRMIKRGGEGWSFCSTSAKAHYFVDGRSLCNRWMFLSDPELEQGNDNSPDNCVICRKKLLRRKERNQ